MSFDGGLVRRDGGGLGGLPTCQNPQLATGDSTTINLDTSLGPPGLVDIGGCGSGNAPQAVIAYAVPGAGRRTISMATNNPGTAPGFDTVLFVPTESCESPPGFCFDDDGMERRAAGKLAAMGGDTVFIVVTGYMGTASIDRGPIELQISSWPSHAPVLEATTVLSLPDGLVVQARGGDEDGDAEGVVVTLHDETKALVDVNANGNMTGDVLLLPFDDPVTGATTFTEVATAALVADTSSAVTARVRLYDETRVRSGELVVPVTAGARAGYGQACGGTTVCDPELQCSETCQATPARAAACASATPVTVPTPTLTITDSSAEGVLMMGNGIFSGNCAPTPGQEQIYTVDVPPGSFDLIATTITDGTPVEADTVLYVRSNCVDPGSVRDGWCNDDDGDQGSTVVIEDAHEGTYSVFVEDFGGVQEAAGTRFEVEISLRPVLATGLGCDPTTVQNRCASGPCPTDTRLCP